MELDLDLVPCSILRLEEAAAEEVVSAVINGHRFKLWFAEREVRIDSQTRQAQIVYRFDLKDPDTTPSDSPGGHIAIHVPMGRAILVYWS